MSGPARKLASQPSSRSRALAREDVVVGRDVIELLSSGMYTDPLTIFREYVQNAADSIDRARDEGTLLEDEGDVAVSIDPAARTIRIRDDGKGLDGREFIRRLASLGASAKRGLGERGFRGVGRLSGLAYAQEVVFRSRAKGRVVLEMRWDCRRLRALLRVAEGPADVASLLAEVVSHGEIPADDYPARFFEVELVGVARLRGDRLLDASAVTEYLAQVAPVPFHPSFSHGPEIRAMLRGAGVRTGDISLSINGRAVIRPHRDRLEVAPGRELLLEDLDIFEVVGTDNRVAAVGWLLHHPYEGALPVASLIKGLRARVGNIQIGEANLFDELFVEPRFNGWTVGEVHVVDARVVPNGRRDGFEQDAQYANFTNRLAPHARAIAHRCRASSMNRKALRDLETVCTRAEEAIATLRQNALAVPARRRLASETGASLVAALRRLSDTDFPQAVRDRLKTRLDALRSDLVVIEAEAADADPLAGVPRAARQAYERVIGLIYECSGDRAAANVLVEKILVGLAS